MRKVINEPGFWMMVFGTVIIGMLLFAGNADCAENKHIPGVQYIVHEVKVFEANGAEIGVGTLGYSLSGKRYRTRYEHYIKPLGQPAVLCLVTTTPPTMGTLIRSIRKFERLGGGYGWLK